MTMRERIATAMAKYEFPERRNLSVVLPPYLKLADAVLAEIEAAGMVLVPREPTEAQLKLCYDWALNANQVETNKLFYRAMLSAAPAGGE